MPFAANIYLLQLRDSGSWHDISMTVSHFKAQNPHSKSQKLLNREV